MSDLGDEDFYANLKKTQPIEDLNIVPILDMFISIIFFILLSTSMVALTKNVLPPSATKSVSTENPSTPLNPKILLVGSVDNLSAIMKWDGASPGSQKLIIEKVDLESPKKIVDEIKKMVGDFKKKYPNEKALQISMKSDFPYQLLISLMDGVREQMPDMILSSYETADNLQE